ncbi:cytochrome c oxidase subunit 1 [Ceratobasidium sp. 370]|nr:cytochrome c oxidase subunit 1 [Ceratobasidium sp. 370]
MQVAIEYLDGQTFEDGRTMNLSGCHADANDMRELLMEKGEYSQKDIRMLADVPGLPDSQWPTRENIIDGLKWLSDGCRAGDRRFFHYAGHGTQVEDQDGDEEDGMDEAIQPADWATQYNREDRGLIIDDVFRDCLVDPLPANSELTAVVDCCHSGTILDMEQETKAHNSSRAPTARGLVPSKLPNMILKLKWQCRGGSMYPVGNILGMSAKATASLHPPIHCPLSSLCTHFDDYFYGTSELPELAKVKDPDEPESPGAERSPITASEYAVLETTQVESPTKQRVYVPIVANVGFTTGLRGAAANYNAMPGGFNTEQRNATYAELFDYIVAQERQAYEERIDYSVEMARLYQDPQLWISASMGDIMDRPVEI